jgi:hypothetical protein
MLAFQLMVVDITYRVLERGSSHRLRVRFAEEDGRSSTVIFRDAALFLKAIEGAEVSDGLVDIFAEDLNILRQLSPKVHYRHQVSIPSHLAGKLGGTEPGAAQEFDLSFEKDASDPKGVIEYLLVAKEWNTPQGQLSLEVGQRFSKDEFVARLRSIQLQPFEVRDRRLSGSASKRRISEDELERLLDPVKSLDRRESVDTGIAV